MRRRLWILLFAVFLTACGQTASSLAPNREDNKAGAPAASESTGPASTTSSVAAIIDTLPADIAITTYQGQDILGAAELNLSDLLAEGRPVVLNFWAGLCPPCRLEMPDLQAVHETFGDQIVLLGLDVGAFTGLGSREDAESLTRELGITYPTGSTANPQVLRDFQVTGMPSTYFIAPNGEIVQKWTGLLTEEKMTELVNELLAVSARL